jgi:LacI family transcriptional regulator
MSKNQTIKDIAKAANCSITAVSLALNHDSPKNISKEKIEEIREVAKRLDYQPNIQAASLKTKKTKTIGFILPDITNPFFSLVVKKSEEEFRKFDYCMFLYDSNDEFKNDLKAIDTFSKRGVDFIIYVPSNETQLNENNIIINKKLKELDDKYIIFDRDLAANDNKYIPSNNILGGYLATKHLLLNNHKKILSITGPKISSSTKFRLEGYKKALSEFNITFDPNLVLYGDYKLEFGESAVKYAIENNVTAVFSFNDLMAYGFIMECKRKGIKIPDDISIIGYDNIDTSLYIDPPLSSIKRDPNEMAESLVKLVLSKLENYEFIPLDTNVSVVERKSVIKI